MKILILDEQIQQKVQDIAQQINKDFEGKWVVFVGILNWAFMFFADLLKHIKLPTNIWFVQLKSYGNDTISSGKVVFVKDLTDMDIGGKNVIIVDDIIDSWLTLKFLVEDFEKRKPKTIKTAVLLDKKERRKVDFEADYIWFQVPASHFVYGYWMDKAWLYRNLPDIYHD